MWRIREETEGAREGNERNRTGGSKKNGRMIMSATFQRLKSKLLNEEKEEEETSMKGKQPMTSHGLGSFSSSISFFCSPLVSSLGLPISSERQSQKTSIETNMTPNHCFPSRFPRWCYPSPRRVHG